MSQRTSSSWRWQVHSEVASTQDLVIEAARNGDAGRLAVIADRQWAGRGSRGRQWSSPAGNLNLSILLRPSGRRPDPGFWAMLAGVATFEALAPYSDALTLKWPNDVLLDGAKLGGVLIESGVDSNGRLDWLVIGVGANLAQAPHVPGRATACLPAPPPCARQVAQAMLSQLDALWDTDIRAAWLSHGHPVGTEIEVVTASRVVRGRFAGLTPTGELLLEGHPSPISSAEIFLRPSRPLAGEPSEANASGRPLTCVP